MKKRILSLVLAVAMVASVATVASAATKIEEGTAITLPEKTLVVDGGFETAAYDDPTKPMKSNIPTFTATEDAGNSTQRPARTAQVITDESIALEGKQCLFLAQGENVTIALPNLYEYKGAKLVLTYYVKADQSKTGYGTWGKLEDRAIKNPVLDETTGAPVIDEVTGEPKTSYEVIYSFADGISYWTQPADYKWYEAWTELKEEIVIPDTIGEKNEYVLNFGAYGNNIYYDAISCVLVQPDGTEVDPEIFAPEEEPEPPVVEEVSVKFAKKTVKLKKGKKATLKVKIKGAKKAKFSVDKKSKKIVKVVKTKKKAITVKGKKKGTAKIVAKVGKKKATCKVKVK